MAFEATLVAIETGMKLTREEVLRRLAEVGYVADQQLAMAIVLMQRLERPLLLEGDAGVGKTEVAKSLAKALGRSLIRLRCYEGLDAPSSRVAEGKPGGVDRGIEASGSECPIRAAARICHLEGSEGRP